MKKLIVLLNIFVFSQAAHADLRCHGVEPYWTADISSMRITLEIIGDDPISSPITGFDSVAGFKPEYMGVYLNEDGATAIVTRRECSNGASDTMFPIEVFILFGSMPVYGCCEEISALVS